MPYDKMVGNQLKAAYIISHCGIKQLMLIAVHEHYWLSRTYTKLFDITLDIITVKGIAVVEKSVEFFRKNQAKDIFFRIFMRTAELKCMSRRNYSGIAGAFECL
jgi:hypothetical protein